MEALDRILRSRAARIAPPLVLAACLWLWAVDVLSWDEWIIWADMLEKLRDGGFGLPDLVAQQNEQRNVAARVFGLLLFPLFRMNRLPELAVIVLLAGACVLLAAWLHRRTSPGEPDARAYALFSLLGFSLLQWETFSFGINTSVILPVLGLWAQVCLAMAGERLSAPRLGAMALAGVLPSFSFANALLAWPCLAPLVALRAGGRRRAWAFTAFWLFFGALVWLAYFTNYAKPGHHPSLLTLLQNPLRFAAYVLAYLGGALTVDRNLLPLALPAGAFALAALGLLGLAAWRGGPEARVGLWPWLCVAAFSLLTALVTAVARSGFGPGQALSSRYATFTGPLWMALAALYLQHGRRLSAGTRRWLDRGLLGCLALFVASSVLGAIVLHNRQPRLERARNELFSLTRPENLLVVFPDPAYVVAKAPLFLAMRAGIYRDVRPLEGYALGGPLPGGSFSAAPAQLLEGRVHGFLLRGLAPGREGLQLFASAGGRIVGLGRVGAGGAFEFFLPENALPAGAQTLQAAVADAGGRTLNALAPADGLPLDNPGREPTEFLLGQHFFTTGMGGPKAAKAGGS